MALVEMVIALAIIFAILAAVMHLARLGRVEQHNRRPGWLERSPNGSVMAPWRESPNDHHHRGR